MKDKKDIIDLFQDSQHRLDEPAPEHVWQKLEQRLDQRSRRRRLPIYRQLSLAAAVIALLIMISVVSLWLPQYSNEDSASIAVPSKWEELGPYADANDDVYRLVELQYQYHKRLDSPVPEGRPDRKIVAQPNKSTLHKSSALAAVDRKKAQVSPSAPTEVAETLPNTSASTSSVAPPLEDTEIAADNEQADYAMEADEVQVLTDEAEAIEADDQHYVKEEAAGNAPAYSRTELGADKLSKAKRKDRTTVGVSQFHWLLGQWEGNAPTGYQIENWRQLSPGLLEGSGRVVVGSDTILIEKMQIEQLGNQINYRIDANGDGQFETYPLANYGNNQAIFENKAISFPQQIILQQGPQNQQFSTTLQNASPSNINAKQQQYLNMRNYIQSEKVQRNLRRVEE